MSEIIKRLAAFILCVTLVVGAPVSAMAAGTIPRPEPEVGEGQESAKNENGEMQANTNISIEVTGTLEIISQTEDCYIKEGADQELLVEVSGVGPFTYTWEVSTDNGATWQPADGATNSESYQITDAQLNPDKQTDPYTYRVTVTDAFGDTVTTEIKITVQEEFAYRRILDEEDSVAVSAWMLRATELYCEPIGEGNAAYDAMLAQLPAGYTPVNAVDLDLYNPDVEENYYTGKQKVEFIVGDEYNGEEVKIYQVVDGAIVEYTAVVVDGIATIEVDSLSQFMVAVESEAYTVTINSGEGGTTQPAGDVSVKKGESQKIVFLPDEGYVVDQVLVDGEPVSFTGNSYTLTDITDDHVVDVSFKKVESTGEMHQVTVNVGKHGKATPRGTWEVEDGDSITITITPDTGYAVDKVLVNGVEYDVVGNYLTLSAITEDTVVDISFVKSNERPPVVNHTITPIAGEGGRISPADKVTVSHGGEAFFYIFPSEGYVIDKVLVDGVEVEVTDSSYHFINVVSDRTIEVTFKPGDSEPIPYYILKSYARGGGTISPEGYTSVPAGGSVTYTFTPKKGYAVTAVWVNNRLVATSGSSYTVTNVDRSMTVHVTFSYVGSAIIPTGDVTTDMSQYTWCWAVMGVAAGVAVVMIILIIVRRRKRDEEEDDAFPEDYNK